MIRTGPCIAIALSIVANLLASVHAQAVAAEPARPMVTIRQGTLAGIAVEGGVAFKNLPYAAPPTGLARWRPPGAPARWKGMRDAAQFGPSCPQEPMGWNDVDAARADEDCLSLNIWTPRTAAHSGAKGLPVMVWMHGGGFGGGSGGNNFSDGDKLMRHGVVVVTINYRVGVLGFLAHPDLAKEDRDGATGNYGLLDQVAALRWVHDNIAVFGGDPANVTAFGQSAGAIGVAWLITAEAAHGLFHRAILESGSAFGSGVIGLPREAAEQIGAAFGPLDELRALPANALLQRWQAFAAASPHAHSVQPVLDGRLLRRQPAEALLAGAGRDIDLIVGSNAQEFAAAGGIDEFRSYIEQSFGAGAMKALAYYFPDGMPRADDPLLGSATSQLVDDVSFRCPSLLAARSADRAWVYHFEQARSGEAATGHSHELVYVFGNWGPEWPLKQPMSAAELTLLDRMQGYWTHFARSGDPNGPGLPVWPRYDRGEETYAAISAARIAAQNRLRGDICPLFVARWSDPAAYRH